MLKAFITHAPTAKFPLHRRIFPLHYAQLSLYYYHNTHKICARSHKSRTASFDIAQYLRAYSAVSRKNLGDSTVFGHNTRMKRLKLLLITLLFSTIPVVSQIFSVDPPTVMKIDEFGALNYSDMMARLDPAAIQLQNDPSSQMNIISYRDAATPIGKTIRTFKFMKQYLTLNRGIDSNRLKFIDGGETKAGFVFQIWIIPAGGKEPELLKPISDSINDTKIARKFDSDYYGFDEPGSEYADGDTFMEYAERIKRESNSTAYVILYPTYYKYNDSDANSAGEIDSPRKTNRVKADISKRLRKAGIPLSKIKIVNGGYRDFRQVELWILPKGVEPPAATPNAFPKVTRKKR